MLGRCVWRGCQKNRSWFYTKGGDSNVQKGHLSGSERSILSVCYLHKETLKSSSSGAAKGTSETLGRED
jgi:hypothetical protein